MTVQQKNDDPDALVDAIYEASFIPERWPSILQKLAWSTDGEGGLLITVDGARARNWIASPFAAPLMERYIEGGYEKFNVRPQRGLAKDHAGFMTDLDVMTESEIATDPIYQEILRPAGVGWTASTYIPAPCGDLVAVAFDRRVERGPYERAALTLLDGFRPHLARAGLLAARLHLEQMRSATETMARLGLPAAALDVGGRVVAKNELLDTLSGQIGIKARDRLHLANARADALFSESMERMAQDAEGVSSIPLPAAGESPPAVLHLLPIRRMAHDIFARTVALVFATPLTPAAIPQADLLGGLFDLSPAENRVARAMMGGMSLGDCARNFGVSQETVRKQLKGIFAKTATSRQTELLQLLASTTSLPIRR
jgi:DNA-binding CsgD family transcriptional regulator